MRLKRNVSKRSLAPLAGGSTRAKKMFQELEAAAENFCINQQILPNVANTEEVERTQPEQEQERPATSLLD